MFIDKTEEKPKWVSPYEKQLERYTKALEKAPWLKEFQKSGIYGIFIEDKIVYIGKSKDIARRLVQHMDEIAYEGPTNIKYTILHQAWKLGYKVGFRILTLAKGEDNLGEAEGIFIRHYLPPLNTKIPREDDWRKNDDSPKPQLATLNNILGLEPKPFGFYVGEKINSLEKNLLN